MTSNRGGLRYCPYAFTEHGIVMLASLLKSATAMEVSVRIVNAFVAMRKFILANAQLFQRIEGVEQRQVATEGKVNEILNRLNAGEALTHARIRRLWMRTSWHISLTKS